MYLSSVDWDGFCPDELGIGTQDDNPVLQPDSGVQIHVCMA
jgi:hypothetical protein